MLNGQSLALISTFGDEIRSDSSFDSYRTWHYVNIPLDKTYDQITPNPEGDIIFGIKQSISVLKDAESTNQQKAFYLKMLVHLIGDLHQPMHVGREEDRGGNDINVMWFNENSNLHRVWDTQMIERFNMSYTELASNLPRISAEEIAQIQEGSLMDWVEDIRVLTRVIYESAEPNDRLRFRYMYDHFGTVKSQLQIAGIRLAKVLNDIFD